MQPSPPTDSDELFRLKQMKKRIKLSMRQMEALQAEEDEIIKWVPAGNLNNRESANEKGCSVFLRSRNFLSRL